VRDILLDGLPILDLLEITTNTSLVASLTNCNQSSVSRLHRCMNDKLGLDFRKNRGQYRAHANHAVWGSLRQAAQVLRFRRCQLQWQDNCWNDPAFQAMGSCSPLPHSCHEKDRTLALVRERVLDLAVIHGLDALPPGWEDSGQPFPFGDLVAIGLVRHSIQISGQPVQASCSSTNLDAVVLLQENLEEPAVQALIAQIREAYQLASQQLPDLAWL